jgi:N-methylhydantoinase A
MRYGNQLVQTTAVIKKHELHGPQDVLDMIQQFSNDYGKRFGEGSQAPESGILINTVRVAAFAKHETVKFENIKPAPKGSRKAPPAPKASRKCYFVGGKGSVETPVWDKSAIEPGVEIVGPGIVASEVTTYLIEPGWTFVATEQGAAWFLQED